MRLRGGIKVSDQGVQLGNGFVQVPHVGQLLAREGPPDRGGAAREAPAFTAANPPRAEYQPPCNQFSSFVPTIDRDDHLEDCEFSRGQTVQIQIRPAAQAPYCYCNRMRVDARLQHPGIFSHSLQQFTIDALHYKAAIWNRGETRVPYPMEDRGVAGKGLRSSPMALWQGRASHCWPSRPIEELL